MSGTATTKVLPADSCNYCGDYHASESADGLVCARCGRPWPLEEIQVGGASASV